MSAVRRQLLILKLLSTTTHQRPKKVKNLRRQLHQEGFKASI